MGSNVGNTTENIITDMGHETWWEEAKSRIESETKKTKTRETERHKEKIKEWNVKKRLLQKM